MKRIKDLKPEELQAIKDSLLPYNHIYGKYELAKQYGLSNAQITKIVGPWTYGKNHPKFNKVKI